MIAELVLAVAVAGAPTSLDGVRVQLEPGTQQVVTVDHGEGYNARVTFWRLTDAGASPDTPPPAPSAPVAPGAPGGDPLPPTPPDPPPPEPEVLPAIVLSVIVTLPPSLATAPPAPP